MTSHPSRSGFVFATGAYLIWGLSPLFWKLLTGVPPFEQLAHRVLWCAVLLAGVLTAGGRWGELARALGQGRVVLTLVASTVFIAANWFVYLYAVVEERIVEASLGYFINPLVTVLLGLLVLGERLSRAQGVALLLAAGGVALLTYHLGQLPWISLVLACSFGLYGLLRKTVDASPEVGLLAEALLLSPLLLAWLLREEVTGGGAFGAGGWGVRGLLLATGVITAVPLLLFTHGARRLPLSTVGFLQYLAPTCQFLLAVLVYREPFDLHQLGAFVLIWLGLVVFTADARRHWRAARRGG